VVRLKLRPDTPQEYSNLLFEDLTLDGAQALFDVKPWTQFFDLGGAAPPKSAVRGVVVRRVTGSVQSLGELRGNPGGVIEGVRVSEVELQAASDRLLVGDGVGLTLDRVTVNGEPYEAATGR
jgi:alpha-L-rhamnosidase